MTPKERDLLEKNEYYLLKSTITDKPYIDQNNGCYMFDVMSDATAFGEALNQDVHIENAKYYPYGVFCTAFYSYGIDHINVKQKGVKDYTVVKLLQEDADKQYFNPFANLLVYRLKQTSKKKYL